MTAEKLTVGQEVRVFDVNGKRHGIPPGGWKAEVVKVARVLATIRRADCRQEQVFRLDSQEANDKYGNQWFRTMDQVALMERRRVALSVLREFHVTLEPRNSLSLEQIEAIAALLSKPGTTKGEDR